MQTPPKSNQAVLWREHNSPFYDFIYESFLDWPVTSVQWGPLLQQTSQYILQRLYFSCKTDGIYNPTDNTWTQTPNYIVMANIQIPLEDHYFINDLKMIFNYDSAKKHPNLKIKQIICHPGEVTVVRSSPMNRKLLASKSDNNTVYLWTSDKYKMTTFNNTPNVPDITLFSTKSERSNYALRFTPSLPRLLTASADKLQLFDIENPPVKRELGSMLSANVIRPLTTLEGHDKVEDIAFKNNEICVSGGQDREIGIWDLRVGVLCHKIKEIHNSDINCVACKGNIILSGGEEGRINLIDDRMNKLLLKFEFHSPIHALQFNVNTNHLAVGRSHLQIYDLDRILNENQMTPIFSHLGMKGNMNEFDWNNESPFTLATTFQDVEHDIASQGGSIHVFRPLDLFMMTKDQALVEMEKAYNKLSPEEQLKLAVASQ